MEIPFATQSFQQAVQQGSPAKSILQEELFLVQLSSALFLDVQKPRPAGKRMTRALSFARENMPLPPSYKSSNFPMVEISPELVTPSKNAYLHQNF